MEATSIDALPDGVLQFILSKLTLEERLALSPVCKRWQAATLSPPLLANVTLRAGADGYPANSPWLHTLRSGTAWLVRRAAGSVQQLTLEVHLGSGSTKHEHAEAAALIAGALAALGAAGSLRQLTVSAPDLPVHLGGWVAAMGSLQRLSVDCYSSYITLSGNMQGLTALQWLRLDGAGTGLTPDAKLPPCLTYLHLGPNEDPEGNAVHAMLPAQVGALTRLQELTLHGDCFKSHHFESLAALGGTLRSLCLDTGISLPDCLPRMLALRTLLIVNEGFNLRPGEDGGPLHAALRKLPSLERLVLDVALCEATAVELPAGPWQGSLKQLAAPADLLAANLALLNEASSLEQLGLGSAGEREEQPAVLRVLRWAAQQHNAPLRRLALQMPAIERPTTALFDACLAVKGAHPLADVQLSSARACNDLLTA